MVKTDKLVQVQTGPTSYIKMTADEAKAYEAAQQAREEGVRVVTLGALNPDTQAAFDAEQQATSGAPARKAKA